MPANASAANTGSLTYEEIEKFVAEWFRKLDLHVPADQLLPLVADSDLEMRFPERQVNGLEEFRDWYAGDPAGERSVGVIQLVLRRDPHRRSTCGFLAGRADAS